MFRKFAEGILVLRWPILLALLLITIVCGGAVLKLQIDPSMEPMFVKSSKEYKYYKVYREKYGSDQMIAVAMDAGSDLFTARNLAILKEVSDTIAKFPEVERVLSLANAMDIKHKFLGVKVVPALKRVIEGKETLSEFRRSALSNELYVGNLVSTDGKVANILVYLKTTDKNNKLSGKFIKGLRQMLGQVQTREKVAFYIAGSPVEQYDFIKLIRSDQMVFVPLIAILLVITTLLIYRNFACMVISMSIVGMTLVWTLGTIALVGQQLNLMTSLLAPVIMIVAVVNSIYLMNVFFEIRPHHPSLKMAVILTIDQLGVPCLLTHLTTVLGFASLAITPIPAIQSFGIFAALGTLYSYIVEIVLTPILMPMLPYRTQSTAAHGPNFFNRVLIFYIEKLEFHWKWLILLLTVAAIFFSVQGIKKIEVDTNIVKQMKPDLPLAVATRFIDERVTGVYSLGFVIKRKDGGSFVDDVSMKRIDEIKSFVESQPAISKVNVITTLIKKIHRERNDDDEDYKIPSTKNIKRYLEGIVESGDPEVFKMIAPDFREIRLEARMRAVGTTEGAKMEEDIRKYLDEKMSAYFDYELTGNVVLLGKMAKDLVKQQIDSFGFAFGSILLVIIVLFWSVRLGLLAAIPNLVPILAVYGIMGYARIELSTPTAMISSIVLGLVVDAAIQFLYRFKIEFAKRHHYLQSLHHTYRNTGHSMVVSTMILVAGFASSVFASFRPTIHFGVLTSLTVFLSLICTLIVLPVCLLIIKPFGPQKLFHHAKDDAGFHK